MTSLSLFIFFFLELSGCAKSCITILLDGPKDTQHRHRTIRRTMQITTARCATLDYKRETPEPKRKNKKKKVSSEKREEKCAALKNSERWKIDRKIFYVQFACLKLKMKCSLNWWWKISIFVVNGVLLFIFVCWWKWRFVWFGWIVNSHTHIHQDPRAI